MSTFNYAHALIVGVGNYHHPLFADLPATVKDAQALATLLKDPAHCGYSPDRVQLLTGEQATATAIIEALQRMTQMAVPDSTVFVYFSGHGAQVLEEGRTQTYLCPGDVDPNDWVHTAITAEMFSDLLAAIPARKLVVVLDACHAAGAVVIKASDGKLSWKNSLPDSYYQALAEGSGRVVIASSREDQYSAIRSQGDLSLFTWHMLKGLEGAASVYKDGYVRVLDLYYYISQQVKNDRPDQDPVLHAKSVDDNFPIALAATPLAPKNVLVEIDSIREHILQDPVAGAKALSSYLAARPKWSTQRIEVDLKRAELLRMQQNEQLFGFSVNEQAEWRRIIFFLLQKCLGLEQEGQNEESKGQNQTSATEEKKVLTTGEKPIKKGAPSSRTQSGAGVPSSRGYGTSDSSQPQPVLSDTTASAVSLSEIVPSYDWSDANDSLIARVDDRNYFLEGLNAVIFAALAEDPLLYERLPNDLAIRRNVIRKIAIALATIDRQYSEQAAKAVIQALWLSEKQTGIRRFVDLLAQRQWEDSNWVGYRDHLNHMLKVYLTGLYLYRACNKLRETLLNASHCTEEEFLRRWLYASTFHDVGYIFELPGPERAVENLKFIQEYIRQFLYYHDQELTDDLIRAGLKSKTIDELHSREILSVVGLHLRDIQSLEDLEAGWMTDKNLLERIDELCRGTGIGSHGLSNYYRHCLSQTPPMDNGRPPFHDHGIVGAVLLLYIGYAQRAIFDSLQRNLRVRRSKKPSALEQMGRSDVLSKMVEWAGDQNLHLTTVEQAASAIALHNIYKDAWSSGRRPWQVDLANFWVGIDEYPLAFFLILVDVLQDWDRPGFNPRHPIDRSIQGSDIDIQSDGERILLGYRSGEFNKTLEQLKKVLRPEQVEKFIAPLDTNKLFSPARALPKAIQAHNKKIIEQLKSDWFDRFINLYMIPMSLRAESGGPNGEQFTILELAKKFSQMPIAILGEPGAGKTTLVKWLAIHYAEQGPRVPIFINMGMYSGQIELQGMFNDPIDEAVLNGLRDKGKLVIIFDGLNEVSLTLREDAARAIANFMLKYPENQFFITCRTAEYPTFLRGEVRRFEVLRITWDIERDYLIRALGVDLGTRVYTSLPFTVRDLCRNPLLLMMLTYLYMGEEKPTKAPTSKVALYEEFLVKLHEREEKLRSIELSPPDREEFLIYLATKMENREVSIKRGTAERWINELYGSRYQGWGIHILTVRHEVLDLPPLKSSRPGHQPDIDISFMHQSFQEFYTARGLLTRLTQGDATPENIALYASPNNEHWWETLTLLVGMMDDATNLIRKIKELAESIASSEGDQRIFTLTARCISEAKHVDPAEVDEVIARILLAFKFGKVALDHDLIYSLKLIRPEQRSSDFPSRLIEDVNWWLAKYVRATAVSLGSSLPIETLLGYLESDDDALVLDTLFTLHGHKARQVALPKLLDLLQRATGTIREEAIVTLGYLEAGALPAVDFLTKVVDDPEETVWARAYALGSLGKIGDSKAVPSMINYMLDHSNPYRDSASWALQGIAKKNTGDVALRDQLKEIYLRALLTETNDREGRYAKGNIVYSLGELDANEFTESIIDWLEGEKEPYVIEDGVQALGRLGEVKALNAVLKHLSSDDFVVRMTAIDAVATIAFKAKEDVDVLVHLQPLLNDRTALVREHAGRAIKKIQQKAQFDKETEL